MQISLFHFTLAAALSATVATVGCRKRQEVQAPAPPSEAPAVSVTPSAAPAPATGPAPSVVTTKASNDAAYIQEMTQTLNDFLGDYIREKKRTPKDISEMVSLKIITSVPTLPAGKRWVINQQTGKISAQ